VRRIDELFEIEREINGLAPGIGVPCIRRLLPRVSTTD
jgi:hypothetical protein